ncbi:MAG: hypothetical protein AAF666_03845 [Pseudomonadota bacterium]
MKYFLIAIATLTLSGCATVVDGTTQPIYLHGNVEGADCSISQGGRVIQSDIALPDTVVVERKRENLIIECSADGYQDAKLAIVAGANPLSVLGHMTTSLLAGAAADSVLGGIGEYQNEAFIHLTKKPIL